jgi:phosphoribosylaminoimidazole-succinocarboxamide synthase
VGETYQVGKSPESFDKQFVRDYLLSIDWNKQPPAPPLPADIIEKTRQKYEQIADIVESLA